MESPKKLVKTKRVKKRKHSSVNPISELKDADIPTETLSAPIKNTKVPKKIQEEPCQGISQRYPIFNNDELMNKFLNVPMNNNQKGRIRQLLRDNLKGTSQLLLPDVIHNRIQTILKSAKDLTDADLRKVRILYNMLKTAITAESEIVKKPAKKDGDKPKKVKIVKEKTEKTVETEENVLNKENKGQMKVKGPKRYVVFVGNLPLGIDKPKLLDHFSELSEYIKDVRIPKISDEKKSAIAYLEMKNEPSYELALCKHHSMLANKRINVLYTAPKNSKISKAEAKSKSAKLIALQRSGKLLGSIPMSRKRSQRRAKMKKALAKQEQQSC